MHVKDKKNVYSCFLLIVFEDNILFYIPFPVLEFSGQIVEFRDPNCWNDLRSLPSLQRSVFENNRKPNFSLYIVALVAFARRPLGDRKLLGWNDN